MSDDICEIDGCWKPRKSWGLCAMHYQRVKRHGDPSYVKSPRFESPEESFAARTNRGGECIVWSGPLDGGGYGRMWDGRGMVRVHRYAWERENGPIPEGMVIDHVCWNRACVKVEHLRLATQALNRQNLSGAQSNSKSGVRGCYPLPSGKWLSVVTVGGERYEMRSETLEEAESKVIAMRLEYMPFTQERLSRKNRHSVEGKIQ